MRKQKFFKIVSFFSFALFSFLCFSIFQVSGVNAQKDSCGVFFNDVQFTAPTKKMGTPLEEVPYLVGDAIDNTKLSFSVNPEDSRIEGANVDIVLVMDRSGSMSGGKIIDAKDALLSAVDYVEQYDTSGESRIGLVTFASGAYLNKGLTKNYQSVRMAIRSFSAGGSTTIGGGLKTAGEHLKRNGSDQNRKFIILASDGQHNVSPSVSEGINSVKKDVTVYTIGIGSGADSFTLRTIAQNAGTKQGKYFFGDSSQLEDIFEDILKDVIIEFEMSDVKVGVNYESQYVRFQSGLPDPTRSGTSLSWDLLNPITKVNPTRNFTLDFNAIGETPSSGGDNLLGNTMDISYTLFKDTPQEKICENTGAEGIPITQNTTEIIPNNLVLVYGENCGMNATRVNGGPVLIGLTSRVFLSSCKPYQGYLNNQEFSSANWTKTIKNPECVEKKDGTELWNRSFIGQGFECDGEKITINDPMNTYRSDTADLEVRQGGGGEAPVDYDRGIWKETAP
jgi:uncharacterized protein YegL